MSNVSSEALLDTYQQGHGEGVSERIAEIFVSEAIDADGQLDRRAGMSAISRGRRVFR